MTYGDITGDIDFLCGSTSATYSNTNKQRNINIHYNDAARLVWESDSGWHFDDSNNTGTPIAYTNLSQNVGTYSIPTTAFRIEQAEIKDNGGNWHKLLPISYKDVDDSPEAFQNSGGIPFWYAVEGNQFRLFPPPVSANVTLASGVALRLSRGVVTLSSTSQTPGFATPFHRFLSYASALDFVQDDKLRQFLILQRDRIANGMVRFYSRRGEQFEARVTPNAKRKWRQYT